MAGDEGAGTGDYRDNEATSSGNSRVTGILVLTAVVSAIGGSLYGYDTGIISGALLQIKDDFNVGDQWQQVIAAGILLGAVIGALVGSRLSEQYGRQRTILIIAVVFVIGTISCSLAPTPLTLALARVVLGMAVGGATQTVPMFVAELSPPKIRGRVVLTFQVAIGVGILVATIVGCEPVAIVAMDDRRGGNSGGADAGSDAAVARKPALAGQGRPGRRSPEQPAASTRRGRRGGGTEQHR